MPTFNPPQYSKVPNPKTGVLEPCYTFTFTFDPNEEKISTVVENPSEVTLQLLQKTVIDNVNWYNTFIEQFLKASAKLFSKPYTVDNINKITKHTLVGSSLSDFPANITFYPSNIKISGGIFTINWEFVGESLVIDIPDLQGVENNTIEQDLPDSQKDKVVDGMEELSIDQLPVASNTTDIPLKLDSPAKFYEKQRVKEARLKAKLAVYKAQRQMAQYYEKYGDDISESESEYDTSDQESEEEEEDVQL
jgi:hypothetical protein